jgi:hypothetical protein
LDRPYPFLLNKIIFSKQSRGAADLKTVANLNWFGRAKVSKKKAIQKNKSEERQLQGQKG